MLVVGEQGTVLFFHNDHLGKHFRARMKIAEGTTTGAINFTKIELMVLLHQVDIMNSPAEVHCLIHHDDQIDLIKTACCLYAVG